MSKLSPSLKLFSTSSALMFAMLSVTAIANTPKPYEIGKPFTLQELSPSTFRQQIEALPEKAQKQAIQQLQGFSFSDQDLEYLKVDKQGAVFYADTFLPKTGQNQDTPFTPEVAGSEITSTEAFTLHSKPGSSHVAYLDFNGHNLSGSAWGNYQAVPYDLDGSPSSFNSDELTNIAEIWRRISEDYAPFDIDITTEEPTTFNSNTGRILITKDTDASGKQMPAYGAGGVAYVNFWGTSNYNYYSPALVYYNRLGSGRADYVTEAASHELGHNLGLSHDGTSSSSYYGGTTAGGNSSWGPIMGTGYNRNVSQWSKGEYSGANNTEDDTAIIANKINYRSDDHTNSLGASATPLVIGSNGSVVSTTPETDPANLNTANKGVIGTQSDIDVFTFNTSGGAVNLQIKPAWQPRYTRGANLDISATLYDANGATVANSDPQDDTNATLNTTLSSGKYYLSIGGVGNSVVPYSDYGSLGQYFISGTIPVSGTPSNNPPVAAFSYNCSNLTCLFTDQSTDTDGSIVSRSWNFGDGVSSTSQNPSHAFSAAGTYQVSLTVRDDDGDTNTVNKSVTVTAPSSNNPPVAAFSYNCSNLACSFTDQSTDSDGSIVSRSWNFGDGVSSTSQNPSHTFSSAGTYSVSLTVTDDDNATKMLSKSVTVTAPASNIQLAINTSSTKRTNRVDLTWSGASGSRVYVYLNGSRLTRTANDGFYRYSTSSGGSYTFKVCETSGSNCSNEVSVQLSKVRMILRTSQTATKNRVNISWTGASGNQVDVYRGNTLLARTANDGFFRYQTPSGGYYSFKVCEAGSSICSNAVSVQLTKIR